MTLVTHMCLIPVLGKRYVKEILLALDKHGPLNLGQLKKMSKCPEGTITRRLNELEKAGLIKSYEEDSRYRLPQRICKLTELGKTALILYDIADDIERLKKNRPLTIKYQIINGHKNIVNSNISNSNIDIK